MTFIQTVDNEYINVCNIDHIRHRGNTVKFSTPDSGEHFLAKKSAFDIILSYLPATGHEVLYACTDGYRTHDVIAWGATLYGLVPVSIDNDFDLSTDEYAIRRKGESKVTVPGVAIYKDADEWFAAHRPPEVE